MKKGPIVAIDGPAGSGKSTVAKQLAKRLGYTHIDSGALYRGVALLALEKNLDVTMECEVVSGASGVKFEFRQLPEGNTLFLDGRNVGGEIRTELAGKTASTVSAFPAVRALLLGLQRDLAKNGRVVMEGRDIGTVVFPHAEVKIFLIASIEERARRRQKELVARGEEVDLETIKLDMAQRDKRDSTRAIAPLKKATDAIEVDTSGCSIESVLDRLESIVRNAE